MPDLGISEIIAIASLVASGVGTGVSVYEQNQQADAQKAMFNKQQQQAAQEALLQKNKAIAAAGPNAQAQTGGSLTGQAGQSFADILAGYSGNQGSPAGGTTSTASPSAATSSNNPLAALINSLQSKQQGGSDFSGGLSTPPPPNQGRFNLTNLNLG